MKPPSEAWEPWWYRWLHGIAILANIFAGGWYHFDLVYGDWPASTALIRLQYSFWLAMAQMALLGLQTYGLVARNLARISVKAELAKLGKIELG